MAAFGVVVCWVFTYTPDQADRPGSPKFAAPKCAAFFFLRFSSRYSATARTRVQLNDENLTPQAACALKLLFIAAYYDRFDIVASRFQKLFTIQHTVFRFPQIKMRFIFSPENPRWFSF
jgi:hypothetical protein